MPACARWHCCRSPGWRMPRIESPMLDRASRAWSLLAATACVLPLLLQLPWRIAAGVPVAGLVAIAVSWHRRAPAWLRMLLALSLVGLVMATMGFRFGRDTGCALLAAMLAVKPMEMHTLRDARSLLGFALFAPFATFLLDQGPVSLLLGLAGALLVLLALLRLSEQESHDPRQSALRQRTGTVLRLVATGLPLALAAFWLFPRLGTPLWGVPERALARPGLSDTMTPGQWLDLMGDDTPVLRVTFFGEPPPQSEMYWRGPALMDYDGRTWTKSRWLGYAPAAVVEPAARTWEYEVEIEPTDQRLLVALELPHETPAGVQAAWDRSLQAERPLGSVTRWRMRASPPRRFEANLPPLFREHALRLPGGFNPRTVALGRQWRAEAGSGNDAAIVQRALRMIRAEFGYTLDTPLPGRHTADEFLFEWKRGFCEHYSSAFVILMRAAGIPARVVTGYAGGYRNPLGGYWVVSQMDAHAWAEVWLRGRGWVRVDPTAAVAPERIYDTLDDRMAGRFGAGVRFGPLFDLGDWMRRGWNDLVLGFDANRQRDLFKPLGGDALGARELAALFAAAAAIALGWMLWLTARAGRERDPVLRAWHRLDTRYARLGLGRKAHEPSLGWAERIATASPGSAAQALSVLSRRFVEWRYARHAGDASEARALVRDLRRHRPGRAASGPPDREPTT